jgi:hypothetical protein
LKSATRMHPSSFAMPDVAMACLRNAAANMLDCARNAPWGIIDLSQAALVTLQGHGGSATRAPPHPNPCPLRMCKLKKASSQRLLPQ